jgi:hypothetical protein
MPSRRFPPPGPSRPKYLFLSRLEHPAGFGVDKMNPRARGTRHRLVALAIPIYIVGRPALHLFAGSWAAVGKWNHGGLNDDSPADG